MNRMEYAFYEENYNWELISAILYVKTKLQHISILDMGGSLGSTWFRYRKLINEIEAEWCVVEQKHYVDCGKENVPEISFFYTIDEAVEKNHANVLLLSSVLMYLDDPYQWLKEMTEKEFEYIIVDESAFLPDESADDAIMLQHVPASIYTAIYPIHLLGLNKFLDFMKNNGYEIKWKWEFRGGSIPIKTKHGLIDTKEKGFLFKKL